MTHLTTRRSNGRTLRLKVPNFMTTVQPGTSLALVPPIAPAIDAEFEESSHVTAMAVRAPETTSVARGSLPNLHAMYAINTYRHIMEVTR